MNRDPELAVHDAIREENLAALQAALDASPLARALGVAFTLFRPGHAEARLPSGALLRNFLGYTHTGAVFALAEQVMAAAANSLGYLGLPLNCEVQFLKGADPALELTAIARVVDTQGRIARVQVELCQGAAQIARASEMVFLRSGRAG